MSDFLHSSRIINGVAITQVDPVFNPDQVMGPDDESPRRMTDAERLAFGLPKRDDNERHGGDPGYHRVLDELRDLHVVKSSGYGTKSDSFANFTAVAVLADQPRFLYPILRSVEKLTRCLSLVEQGRFPELGEEFKDVASLMVCAESLRRQDGKEQ